MIFKKRAGLSVVLSCLLAVFCGVDPYKKEEKIIRGQILRLKDDLIDDFTINSERPYDWTLIGIGSRVYMDRDFEYLSVPSELLGNLVLKPSNNDKFYGFTDPPYISFKLKKNATIYIIYTNVSSSLEALWLNEAKGWKKAASQVEITLWYYKSTRHVRSQFFGSGALVKLGGNACSENKCDMYTVVIVPEKGVQMASGRKLPDG